MFMPFANAHTGRWSEKSVVIEMGGCVGVCVFVISMPLIHMNGEMAQSFTLGEGTVW